jgi:CubicO group peptidase (beta-lactamase class C family)
MATDPNGGTPTLERYFGGGAYSTNFYILPRRDLVLVLMQQVTPTNHGGADQAFYRIVNAAIEK